ncbi:hypothetical protein OPV22_018194 [Ensete ventricosum]|uniref:Uncharacterized protein n=1 Tax=Ensete ventricosum TaxID=4639 RepID=A0AAV8QQ21_ENSVE|nr:hypothetical protein OPV22_018194 [Ensete ventricosum]
MQWSLSSTLSLPFLLSLDGSFSSLWSILFYKFHPSHRLQFPFLRSSSSLLSFEELKTVVLAVVPVVLVEKHHIHLAAEVWGGSVLLSVPISHLCAQHPSRPVLLCCLPLLVLCVLVDSFLHRNL